MLRCFVMVLKDCVKKLLFYMTVPKCVCCGEKLDIDDRALCKNCLKEYEASKNNVCSICFKQLTCCKCSNKYLKAHMMPSLTKIFLYKPSSDPNEKIPSNQLIYVIKRVRRKDLLDFISEEMIYSIKNSLNYENFVVSNVPRKRSRVLKYGFDHSKEIAKAISKKLGLTYVKLLKSESKVPQKKLHGEDRIKNAKFDVLKRQCSVKGKRVLLIDDIVTTGASMGASAMLIRALGAKEVVGACLAIAYRDDYHSFT